MDKQSVAPIYLHIDPNRGKQNPPNGEKTSSPDSSTQLKTTAEDDYQHWCWRFENFLA